MENKQKQVTELGLDDNIVFDDGNESRTFVVKNVVLKDFSNPIWRSGFWYGLMVGAALILVLIAGIIIPYLRS